jgi:molybdenum cofactor cytidylyltransferase
MGRPKLALPLGGRTVLERVIASLRDAAVDRVLVVLGPHVANLVTLAEAAGADVLLLTQETADMRATVEAGLAFLEQHWQPRPEDAWLLVPADHPTLDVDVVRQLIRVCTEHPERSIVVPTHQGKRGHPALIAWKHVTGMRSLPAGQGLNSYLRLHSTDTHEVPVETAAVLDDLDTPADYERLAAAWRARS